MYKFNLLLVLLLLSCISISQEINELNKPEETKKEAPKCRDIRFRMSPQCDGTVYFDEDKKAVMHKKSGKPFSGSCITCFFNGNLEMFLTYQGGMPVGIDTVWYENGQPQLIRGHDAEGSGKENGSWRLYRTNGSLKWEKNYVYGAEDGESRYYFPDSSLHKIESWSMGAMDGMKQEYYPNNTLKKEIMYSSGEWNGKYITYFDNGLVESEQEYKMGKKEGMSRYYYENGALFFEEFHENGCREGEFRRFYPLENRMWTVENYKNNMRHGLFEEYYDNDKNIRKYSATFKKGKLIEEHFYDEFGDEATPEEGDKTAFGNAQDEKDKKDLEDWPENPSDDWLAEKKVSRKEYNKARGNYFWYQKKQKKEKEKEDKKVKC
jgi:antitoxin component YwqK of YwqJK toxin-antitoxin module